MKKHLTSDDWSAIREKHAKMTPEEAKAWIRKVMGPPRRTLEGQEKDNVWLMIQLIDEPTSASNNQRTITEVYHLNQKEYHVTYFDGDDFEIDEMLPDD
jgi:hypothetical protein